MEKTMTEKRPEGYDDLFLYVPEAKQILRVAEGTGDNLLPEDVAEGYVDYLIYEQHDLDMGLPEADGGQILLTELARDKYGCLADAIPDVLDMAYDDNKLDYVILA